MTPVQGLGRAFRDPWMIGLMLIIAVPVLVALPVMFVTRSYETDAGFEGFRGVLTLIQIGLVLVLGAVFFVYWYIRRYIQVQIERFLPRQVQGEVQSTASQKEVRPLWMKAMVWLGNFDRRYRKWPNVMRSVTFSTAFIAPAIIGALLILATNIDTTRVVTAVLLAGFTMTAGIGFVQLAKPKRTRKQIA